VAQVGETADVARAAAAADGGGRAEVFIDGLTGPAIPPAQEMMAVMRLVLDSAAYATSADSGAPPVPFAYQTVSGRDASAYAAALRPLNAAASLPVAASAATVSWGARLALSVPAAAMRASAAALVVELYRRGTASGAAALETVFREPLSLAGRSLHTTAMPAWEFAGYAILPIDALRAVGDGSAAAVERLAVRGMAGSNALRVLARLWSQERFAADGCTAPPLAADVAPVAIGATVADLKSVPAGTMSPIKPAPPQPAPPHPSQPLSPQSGISKSIPAGSDPSVPPLQLPAAAKTPRRTELLLSSPPVDDSLSPGILSPSSDMFAKPSLPPPPVPRAVPSAAAAASPAPVDKSSPMTGRSSLLADELRSKQRLVERLLNDMEARTEAVRVAGAEVTRLREINARLAVRALCDYFNQDGFFCCVPARK
jgi:hypothetical protein